MAQPPTVENESPRDDRQSLAGFRPVHLIAGLGSGGASLAVTIAVTFHSGLWWQSGAGRWACLASFVVGPTVVSSIAVLFIALRRPWVAAGLALAFVPWVIAVAWSFVANLQRFGAW